MKKPDFEKFLATGELEDSQVGREIKHIFNEKDLMPRVFIAYDRLSYKSKNDTELRITFDTNLRFSWQDLRIDSDENSGQFFENQTFIMETKTCDGFPPWLVEYLSKEEIYPTSFSKYGKIYQEKMQT